MLHGTYEPGDCTFLLKPVEMQSTDVAAKERAIQSGQRHYSEMLSVEKAPSSEYMRLFYQAVKLNGPKLARHIASLARTIAARGSTTPVVVSLARAGTPIGVLVHRALQRLGLQSTHYCVSIIRDRGVDWVALDHIRRHHRDSDIVFIDGWTGKGVISNELATSVAAYNQSRGSKIDGTLAAIADLAGAASLAVTAEDYLIPNAVLNATVSGLISRTVLNADHVGDGDFHACVYYGHLEKHDVSRIYVDALNPYVLSAVADEAQAPLCNWTAEHRRRLRAVSDQFVGHCMAAYQASHRNFVKPGIGESTRALLRRVPDRLLLADPAAEDVQHLVALARSKRVPVECVAEMPYRAAAIIMSVNE